MDIDGGMKTDIYDSVSGINNRHQTHNLFEPKIKDKSETEGLQSSFAEYSPISPFFFMQMAEGVQGAACVICFMTQAYQDSANCKLELKFAQQSGVPIIPVMMQPNFTPKQWLGILTAGSIWTPMYDSASVVDGVDKVIAHAQQLVPEILNDADASSEIASETSEGTQSFDIGAWGDQMFSLAETREELERLRGESDGHSTAGSQNTDMLLCKLPAMVPALPRGLYVTNEMELVLAAVLSASSTSQIGFCGMGGIGKTTVSTWVAHNESVRSRFGMIAWISLGQTPAIDSCISLLYLQLAGSKLADGLSPDQKHEYLTQAFGDKSVLLVLDDCWDADVAAHFKWIDTSTNSKVLISSRVRDALDGGEIIDVTVPSKTDAIKMLLSTAGMEAEGLESRKEVAQVAELCKRLPLTIGIAGKLIRQLAHGTHMPDSNDWADVVDLLQAELNDPHGDLSIEESVIRASIKSIPKKIRPQVTRLFNGFAMAPEDMALPLPVLGMIYHANSGHAGAQVEAPMSRIHIRKFLKVLIDRSLVLGSVDRPQVHDIMLDYVRKELAGDAYKAAQRRLVELFRKADRGTSSATGKYIKLCTKHHVSESSDATWGKGEQAMRWLEGHINGVPDAVATATATTLPDMEMVAKEAEDAKKWWSAVLRWNALGYAKMAEMESFSAGFKYLKHAVEASENIVMSDDGTFNGNGSSCTQFELDSLNLEALVIMLMSWDPVVSAQYGEACGKLALTDAGTSSPLLQYKISLMLEWFPAMLSGNADNYAACAWKLATMAKNMVEENTDAYSNLTDEERYLVKPMPLLIFGTASDAMYRVPDFTLDHFGPNGDNLLTWTNAYVYEDHHSFLAPLHSLDFFICSPAADWLLTLVYGRVADSMPIVADRLRLLQRVHADKASPTRSCDLAVGIHSAMASHHIHGQSHLTQPLIDALGLTYDTVDDYLINLPAAIYTTMEQRGPGGGLFPLTRLMWQLKSFMVMHTDVPSSKAIAWLESLPDDDEFYQISMTMPTHDHGGFCNANHQTCWIALAHEHCGLYEGALRFCRLALEPDQLKAGQPHLKWAQTIAAACKGRVLTKLKRHSDALSAFQAAVSTAKLSYPLMEALAYRELAECDTELAPGPFAAAVEKAQTDLSEKLKEFEGQLSSEEFGMLSIGLP